jgi:hypothetical protein
MCFNPECVFITIGVDDFGDRYINHYRYNQTKTDLIVLFRQYIESQKTKKQTKQHQNYHYLYY